jgi:hypothetical protein
MKKLLILGTVLLSSCSSYRIEVVRSTSGTFYTPARRHGLHWDAYYYAFPNKLGAINQIYGWHTEEELHKSIKSQYIYFK